MSAPAGRGRRRSLGNAAFSLLPAAILDACDQLFNLRQNSLDDAQSSLGRRVNTVWLIELGHRRNALEEKFVVQHGVPLGQTFEDAGERLGVFGAQIGRRAHAGEQDGQTPVRETRQDGVKIGEGLRRIDRAERVVRAQFQDHPVGVVGERPVQPGKAGRGGVARIAAVDHRYGMAPLAQGPFELGRKRLVGGQPETGRQAVAEREKTNLSHNIT